jgi:xanthine/uracil permease
MVESIGDYHACSVMAGAGKPSFWQISRGIGAEGLGCALTGCLGGFSSTSYSENIGLVGITKVGSRFVVFLGALILLALGFFTKLGMVVATMPDPIVGALYCALFGLISAVGIQQLSQADLRRDRTLLIAGFSLFMGLSVPAYFGQFIVPGVTTGHEGEVIGFFYLHLSNQEVARTIGEVIGAIGKSGMAVAAITGLILDNLIPGTPEERGIVD